MKLKISILAVLIWVVSCSSLPHFNKTKNLGDLGENDEVLFFNPENIDVNEVILPSIFKALNPKYIANTYGFTKECGVDDEGMDTEIVFSLVAFDQNIPQYNTKVLFTSLNAQNKWNYYINNFLLHNYKRAFVSALMLQAIEKIEFIPTDTLVKLYAFDQPQSMKMSEGSIHFYTRSIAKNTVNDRKTVYVLNDSLVITRKIYEAINPVFLRSLNRITDPAELKKNPQYKGKKEIVKIDVFRFEEVIDRQVSNKEKDEITVSTGFPSYTLYVVDNIPIEYDIYKILNKNCFKEIRYIDEDAEKSIAPYLDLFPKEKLKLEKEIVVVIL